MIKERFNCRFDLLGENFAEITKNDDKVNPYEVNMKISFATYEDARMFIESAGFDSFKKIVRD